MSVTVRPLAQSDRMVWEELWTAYLDFYETQLPIENFFVAWDRLMGDDYYDGRGLIAEADGEAVGLAHYFYQRHGWKMEDVTYLQDLYVKESARGTGAGRALIEAVYAAADDADCPTVYWMTAHDNEVARRLYDRIGDLTPFIKYQRPAD